ncbi:MAG: hypothetical protein R3C49_07305 [Planctomycetaceae bacterium]
MSNRTPSKIVNEDRNNCPPPQTSVTLRQAFDAYQQYLKKEYDRPETGQISPLGKDSGPTD